MPKPRRPFKFWAMATGMAVFSLLGLLFVIVGPNAETRMTGVMCILFFGVGGLGFLGGPMLTRRGAHTVRRERLETSAGSEAAFVFPTPAAKRWSMVIAGAGMAGGSAILAVRAGGVMIAAAAVFVLFFVFMLLSARRPQYLALTPTRLVASAGAGTVELPWDAVADAEIYEMPAGQATVDMLGVAARDPDAAVWTRGAMLGRFNRRFSSGYDLTVGADTFAGEGEDVVAAILRYRDEPDRQRAIGGEEEHARLLRELGETAVRTEAPAG